MPRISENTDAQLNPLLQELFPPFFVLAERPSRWHAFGADKLKELAWYQDKDWQKSVLRPNASWRTMYPVQPPAKIEQVILDGYCCTDRCIVEETTINPALQYSQASGTLMGLLYDVVIQLLDSQSVPSFFVQWHMVPRTPDPIYHYDLFEPENLQNKIIVYSPSIKQCDPDYRQPLPTGLQIVNRNVSLLDDRKFMWSPSSSSTDKIKD